MRRSQPVAEIRGNLGVEFSALAHEDRTHVTMLDEAYDQIHFYPDGTVTLWERRQVPMPTGRPLIISGRHLELPAGSWRRVYLNGPVGRMVRRPSEVEVDE